MATPHLLSGMKGRMVAMPSPLEVCSCKLLEFKMLESSLVAPLLFLGSGGGVVMVSPTPLLEGR